MYDKYTEKAIDKAIQGFKRKKDDLEIHATKLALITWRKSFIENQKRHNYNMEYERLISVLNNKVITHVGNKAQLESRVKHLETLGSKAVTGIDPRKRQTYDEIMNEVKNS